MCETVIAVFLGIKSDYLFYDDFKTELWVDLQWDNGIQ
jgi:hypothetical protein